jgi:hypothetical protein
MSKQRKSGKVKLPGRPPKYGVEPMIAISLRLPTETITKLEKLAREAGLRIDDKRTGYNGLATQVLVAFANERRVIFEEMGLLMIKISGELK